MRREAGTKFPVPAAALHARAASAVERGCRAGGAADWCWLWCTSARRRRSPPPCASRSGTKTPISATRAALSPGGSQLAFIASAGGRPMLWVRPLDSVTARCCPALRARAIFRLVARQPFIGLWCREGQEDRCRRRSYLKRFARFPRWVGGSWSVMGWLSLVAPSRPLRVDQRVVCEPDYAG